MAYTTIDDPSAYFQTKIYTGNGGSLAVTNDGNSNLQPDLAWFKKRGGSESHALFDTSRGIDRFLSSNSTAVEQHQPTTGNTDADDIASFDSDGFTFQGGGGAINQSSNTYVAWQWKCNAGTTETAVTESGNNPGNVRQTNTTAGFSIITFTGTGAAGTIAHGLGAVPELMIVKNRGADVAHSWIVYHKALGNTHFLELNASSVPTDYAGAWNDTTPTSSVFTVQTGGTNADGETRIAYVFTPIQGYSKFGSYIGNGNANGPFLYTGFKPAWTMIKETGATGSWYINDNKRDTSNLVDSTIYADLANAEATETANAMDYYSNGFKLRGTGNDTNLDDGTYIYMAFAEHPFVTSSGVPATAR